MRRSFETRAGLLSRMAHWINTWGDWETGWGTTGERFLGGHAATAVDAETQSPRHGDFRTFHHHAVDLFLTAASFREHRDSLEGLEPPHFPTPRQTLWFPRHILGLLALESISLDDFFVLVGGSRRAHFIQRRAPHFLRFPRQPDRWTATLRDRTAADAHAKLVHRDRRPAHALLHRHLLVLVCVEHLSVCRSGGSGGSRVRRRRVCVCESVSGLSLSLSHSSLMQTTIPTNPPAAKKGQRIDSITPVLLILPPPYSTSPPPHRTGGSILSFVFHTYANCKIGEMTRPLAIRTCTVERCLSRKNAAVAPSRWPQKLVPAPFDAFVETFRPSSLIKQLRSPICSVPPNQRQQRRLGQHSNRFDWIKRWKSMLLANRHAETSSSRFGGKTGL